jgi:acyl-CoA dehydrogenase
MATLFFLAYIIFTLIVLYRGMQAIVWEVGSVIYLIVATFILCMPILPGVLIWFLVIASIIVLHSEALRAVITDYLFKSVQGTIPKLSKTEEEALNSGDVWFEEGIFRGEPNWQALEQINYDLTEEEKAFLDNETETLCSMLDEWEIKQNHDMPEKVWKYIKEKGFFGMIIPKEYGGKGFSALAHSEVVMKIASRSGVAAVTVMVPNSLGPGELLHYYGTKEQKDYYLPRLAKGEEVPCFALTEPNAGSDATSIVADALVCKKKVDGKMVLGLEINKLNKRWITLAPIASLIGLAVNLRDPEGLLKGKGQEGITCLLLPRDTKNLEIGNRHLPTSLPFMNGTVRGEAIFVPMNTIIGGQEKAGQGWHMLVECLSIGRSISLPALGTASASVSYLTAGAFSRIRRQFNVEIANFEGIEEKLAEIAGLTYMVHANRLLTAAAVDQHKKPSVASAITKYANTELARKTINDAMDVHAGRAVVIGPRNYLMNFYQSIPISTTVEGANVMTRNLLIFGQGSIACHPYVRDEFYAISQKDKHAFSTVIWKHIHYFMRNFAKTVCSAWTGGIFVNAPANALNREYKKLSRLSHAFAWLSDAALILLGGSLKRRERLSARLADAMSYLYIAMAVIRFYEKSNQDEANQQHAKWALHYCFYQAQKAMINFCRNFPSRFMGFAMRLIAFPFGQTMSYPKDKMDHLMASLMTENNSFRDFLKSSSYLSSNPQEPVDRMEHALQLILQNQPIYDKIKHLKGYKFHDLEEKLAEELKNKNLSQKEVDAIIKTEKARWDAIQVDEYTFDSMKNKTFASVIDKQKTPFD